MAITTVNTVIGKAQTILQDATGVRWPRAELIGWLNDAYRDVILARPDANSSSGTFTCAAGTRQKLVVGFPSALRLLDVVRNVAASGAHKAVRALQRNVLDDQRPGWHAETPSVDIEHFIFDPKVPTEFLVYPPATSSAQLEVLYSSVPTAHATSLADSDTSTVIGIDDSYANVLLDLILYRAYSKDAEYAANAARAVSHQKAAADMLGIKSTVDAAVTPVETDYAGRASGRATQP